MDVDSYERQDLSMLTHWGRMTHICLHKLTIIGSDNALSPERRQASIWTNAGILLIGTLGTNFSEILSEIHTFSFKKMHLKISSAKRRPFCLGLNVLMLVKLVVGKLPIVGIFHSSTGHIDDRCEKNNCTVLWFFWMIIFRACNYQMYIDVNSKTIQVVFQSR